MFACSINDSRLSFLSLHIMVMITVVMMIIIMVMTTMMIAIITVENVDGNDGDSENGIGHDDRKRTRTNIERQL